MAKKKPIFIDSEEEKSDIILTTNKESKLKASEWARQYGLASADFLWWDTNKGLIIEQEFLEIKKQIGR